MRDQLGDFPEINGLVAEVRNEGVGTQLIASCERMAVEERAAQRLGISAAINNVNALRLYQRLGFEPWEDDALTEITFLGTGNFLAAGRYWNSFVIDRSVLVEPCPTVLPHLRRCGIGVDEIDLIAISHFHADHTFGWPFLLLELVQSKRRRPLTIVGPPGVEAYLAEMLDLGGVPNIAEAAQSLDLRFREIDGRWHSDTDAAVRGVAVEHVEHLECFGFLFDRGDQTIGYSGDTRPCDGLVELAERSDVLVIECNDRHTPTDLPSTHMDVVSVLDLQQRFPDLRLVLTHLGRDVHADLVPGAITPNDFDTLSV